MARLLRTDSKGNAYVLADNGATCVIESNGAPLVTDSSVLVLDNATLHLDHGVLQVKRATTAVTSLEKYLLAGGE